MEKCWYYSAFVSPYLQQRISLAQGVQLTTKMLAKSNVFPPPFSYHAIPFVLSLNFTFLLHLSPAWFL